LPKWARKKAPLPLSTDDKPLSLPLLTIGRSRAEPNVAIHVRTSIVQVQVEQARIRTIVPIAATKREDATNNGFLPVKSGS